MLNTLSINFCVLGFCLGRESLHNICSSIHSDAILYTLIRGKFLSCIWMFSIDPNSFDGSKSVFRAIFCSYVESWTRQCFRSILLTTCTTEAFFSITDPSLPVRCPFQDAYHFSYNNNTGGFCMSPMSYVHACASDASFRFQYRHCDGAAYTHDKSM